ncbi:tRNA dihydrouridine synthase [Nanoarchaeota archaeon]
MGNLRFKNKCFLAPMAEINDIAFRLLCKKAGAGLVYTGMVNPLTKQTLVLDDKPVIQLFSMDGRGIKEFIKKYEGKAQLFDFNLGCPARVAERSGIGSYLTRDLKTIEKILKEMRKATKKPITIKLRKGPNTLKIVKIAEKYCDGICIHPRTKEQGYSGKADVEYAERLKKGTKLSVIYSGDVDENNVKGLLKKFDFVMVGRKAIGNPNIFAKIAGKKAVFGFNDYLKLALKYKFKFSHIKSQAMYFTKNQKNAKELRGKLVKAQKISDIRKIMA